MSTPPAAPTPELEPLRGMLATLSKLYELACGAGAAAAGGLPFSEQPAEATTEHSRTASVRTTRRS